MNIEVSTEPGRDSAFLTWDSPLTNGTQEYIASITPTYPSDHDYKIGTSEVTYEALSFDDEIVTNCSFTVTVKGISLFLITCNSKRPRQSKISF